MAAATLITSVPQRVFTDVSELIHLSLIRISLKEDGDPQVSRSL